MNDFNFRDPNNMVFGGARNPDGTYNIYTQGGNTKATISGDEWNRSIDPNTGGFRRNLATIGGLQNGLYRAPETGPKGGFTSNTFSSNYETLGVNDWRRQDKQGLKDYYATVNNMINDTNLDDQTLRNYYDHYQVPEQFRRGGFSQTRTQPGTVAAAVQGKGVGMPAPQEPGMPAPGTFGAAVQPGGQSALMVGNPFAGLPPASGGAPMFEDGSPRMAGHLGPRSRTTTPFPDQVRNPGTIPAIINEILRMQGIAGGQQPTSMTVPLNPGMTYTRPNYQPGTLPRSIEEYSNDFSWF